MAFPRTSSIVLWFSLILFVYWTTSAAESHDPSPADLSALRRLKRELDSTTKERVQSGFQVGVDFLTTVTDLTNQIQPKQLESVFKALANFASLAPGIGSLVISFVNVILAFVPQEDELKNGFNEVNRRLDLLAFQISDLSTDVEWFNFASVYSRDETRILNAWRKLDEFQQNLKLVTSEEEKLRLAEIFASFYENSETESSVANIYHYLTVTGTSLSKNINSLLRDKFKCSISEIGRFNLYLSSLLWKGMVLNQLYWKLIGFSSSGQQHEHNRMFKNVFKAQNDALQYCLDNFEQYLVKDVEVVSKRFTKDQKEDIAANVRKTLDEKYFWYNWTVVVYEEKDEANYKLVDMWRVPVGELVVAVGYFVTAWDMDDADVGPALPRCFANTQCSNLKQKSQDCNVQVLSRETLEIEVESFTDYARVLHYFYRDAPVVLPPPSFNQVECTLNGYRYKVNVYLSRRLPVCSRPDTCLNGGVCRRLMESNEHLCDCPDGYYGNRCESSTSSFQNVDIGSLVPDITTLNTKLDRTEDKLDRVLDTLIMGWMCGVNMSNR
uniref:EGF-like domain-containing protein n=1 Tax=Sphaeramia orbicularis TaxID=375764 RepID=A0A672YN66_9TELE